MGRIPTHDPARKIRERTKVDPRTGCWEWQGHRNSQGYGTGKFPGGSILAHRQAYMTFVGPVAQGLCVLHRCDNPACCNPEHLFLGTRDQNMADRNGKLRQAWGGRIHSAILDEEAVREIRRVRNDRYFAEKYGVAQITIYQARVGITWRHLDRERANG